MRTRLVVALVTAIAMGVILSAAQAHGGGVGGGGIARMGGISRPARGPFRPTPGMSRPVPRATAKLEIELPRWSPTVYRTQKAGRPGVNLSRPPVGELQTSAPAASDVASLNARSPENARTAHEDLPATIPGKPALATPHGPLRWGPENRTRRPGAQAPDLQTPANTYVMPRTVDGSRSAEAEIAPQIAIRPRAAAPGQLANRQRLGDRSNRPTGSAAGNRDPHGMMRGRQPKVKAKRSVGPNLEDIGITDYADRATAVAPADEPFRQNRWNYGGWYGEWGNAPQR